MIFIIMFHQSNKFFDFGFTLSPQHSNNYNYLACRVKYSAHTGRNIKLNKTPKLWVVALVLQIGVHHGHFFLNIVDNITGLSYVTLDLNSEFSD